MLSPKGVSFVSHGKCWGQSDRRHTAWTHRAGPGFGCTTRVLRTDCTSEWPREITYDSMRGVLRSCCRRGASHASEALRLRLVCMARIKKSTYHTYLVEVERFLPLRFSVLHRDGLFSLPHDGLGATPVSLLLAERPNSHVHANLTLEVFHFVVKLRGRWRRALKGRP